MIATIIAYCLTLFLFGAGVVGLYQTARSKQPKHSANSWVIGSIVFLFAALVSAKIGGI